MHLRFRVLLACAFLVAFVNCGDITQVETEEPAMPDTYTALVVSRRADASRWYAATRTRGEGAESPRESAAPSSAPYPTAIIPPELVEFFRCVIQHESATSGVYAAVNPSGRYRGAYQMDVEFWRSYAPAEWTYLAGAHETAPPEVQDATALNGYRARGPAPWMGACTEYAV